MQAAGALLSAGLGLGSAHYAMQAGNYEAQASNAAVQVAQNALPNGAGIGPMFDIIAGQQQQQSYEQQASALSTEAGYALQTSLLNAAQNDYQTARTQAEQNAQFSASGVTLAGSPLGILTETQQLGNQVSAQTRLQGQLSSQLLGEQGLQMLRQGSAAAFAGQAGALSDQYNYELQRAQASSALFGAQMQNYSAGLQRQAAANQQQSAALGLGASGIFAGLNSFGNSSVGKSFLSGLLGT